ncbi:hypothetical protein MRX96_047875 [Rhipicephalus microplus]
MQRSSAADDGDDSLCPLDVVGTCGGEVVTKHGVNPAKLLDILSVQRRNQFPSAGTSAYNSAKIPCGSPRSLGCIEFHTAIILYGPRGLLLAPDLKTRKGDLELEVVGEQRSTARQRGSFLEVSLSGHSRRRPGRADLGEARPSALLTRAKGRTGPPPRT